MSIKVYSEQDLRNQELLKSLANGASAQSAIVKSQLDGQWSENVQGVNDTFFIQDFSGAGLFNLDSKIAGSWYRIGNLVFLDVSFTFPNNSDIQTAKLGIRGDVGVPPPPLSDSPNSYAGLIYIDGVSHKLTMIDGGGGDIIIDIDDYDGLIPNSALSDAVIQFKAFYKAQ